MAKDTSLTPTQQKVLDYLIAGKPRHSLRQMSIDSGVGEHPHIFVQAVSALLMKGYLKVDSTHGV